MIKVEGLTKRYARHVAVDDISFEVTKGEIVGFLGPNGAGKTTLLNSLSAVIPPGSGDIIFEGASIRNLPPDRIVKHGISQVPEGRQVFNPLSVADNLELGASLRLGEQPSLYFTQRRKGTPRPQR